MINKTQCVELLLKEFPEYRSIYEENKHTDADGKDLLLLVVVMGNFASLFAKELIEKNELEKFKKVAKFIEKLIIEGNEAVSNAAKVGFLEALTNQVKFKKGDVGERFAKYLGEKSKEFCVDLDRFWGTKTI